MNVISRLVFIAAMASLSSVAYGACDYPSRITIPNGTDASKEEMLEGSKAIKAYMNDMNAYLDCLESENQNAGEEGEAAEITEQRNALFTKRYNAAVEEMESQANEFNVQVRAYKAKGAE
ncbi:MAG: hypothetical protein AAAFM81_10220 [Pseudomonadota bacterium]